MKTGMESMQSTTIQFYYRGFSILLTKRDESVSMQGLLSQAMLDIDWAITHNVQPSWNKATNEEVAEIALTDPAPVPAKSILVKKTIPVSQFEQVCEKCGSKKGISKAGNPYCLAKCWLK
jgi:hypothetical protein